MFKIHYSVSHYNAVTFVSRWFWESPLVIYERAKKQRGVNNIHHLVITRIY